MTTAPVCRSELLRIRGLRYHLRLWGRHDAPLLFLLHGFLDVSATWAPIAQELAQHWQVIAPDWRGFGHTEWPVDGYWFEDYVADLDALVNHYAPAGASVMVGHSMGSQVASLYAGLRPSRVSKLVCLDGIGLPDMAAEVAPQRYRKWLDGLLKLPRQKDYASFDELASRVQLQHPRLSLQRAGFVARCWGREDGRGRISLCADPRHRLPFPGVYRADESLAIWREVQAPTLFIDAGDRAASVPLDPAERQRRRQYFRDARVVVIEEAGHMLHFDAPAATAAAMSAFLGG